MIKYKTQKIFLARRPTVYNRQLLRSYPAFPGLGLPVEQAPSSHLWTSNAPLSTDPLAGPGAGLLDPSAFAVGAPLWLGFWFGGMVYFLERGRLSSLERGGCPLWNGVAVPSGTGRIFLSGLRLCLGRCPGGGGLVDWCRDWLVG